MFFLTQAEHKFNAQRSLYIFQVKQFYKQFIKSDGPERRKLVLSITPDPTLNHIQVRTEIER
jgi:hypothetical protein